MESHRSGHIGKMKISDQMTGAERRDHRRHDMENQGVVVERYDGRGGRSFGQLVDISASGMRLRTTHANVRADQQIRVRLELPSFAGIQPFVNRTAETLEPKKEWVGWMAVSRVQSIGRGQLDVAGRLVDMDEMDRGMLSLYLSTQPLAA